MSDNRFRSVWDSGRRELLGFPIAYSEGRHTGSVSQLLLSLGLLHTDHSLNFCHLVEGETGTNLVNRPDSMKMHLPLILRPRLTWRYVASAFVATYLTYSFLFASPVFSSRLPAYRGEYGVGAIDIESPIEKRVVRDARFRQGGQPAFQVSVSRILDLPPRINSRNRLKRSSSPYTIQPSKVLYPPSPIIYGYLDP